MKRKCETCSIHKDACREGGCCIWYMENDVCGNKTTEECTEYKEDSKAEGEINMKWIFRDYPTMHLICPKCRHSIRYENAFKDGKMIDRCPECEIELDGHELG